MTDDEPDLAGHLAALEAEVARLDRQTAADHVTVDYCDDSGHAEISLSYRDLGGDA